MPVIIRLEDLVIEVSQILSSRATRARKTDLWTGIHADIHDALSRHIGRLIYTHQIPITRLIVDSINSNASWFFSTGFILNLTATLDMPSGSILWAWDVLLAQSLVKSSS